MRAALSAMQLRIFDVIEKSGGAGVDVFTICDKIYTGANGGPEMATLSVRQQIHNARTRLKPHGLTIKATGGPESRYFLTKVKKK